MEGITIYAIFVTVIALIGIYTTYNLMIKSEAQEEAVIEADEHAQKMEKWILSFKEKVEVAYLNMKEIDTREAFASEDEVGTTFKALVEIINELQEITK